MAAIFKLAAGKISMFSDFKENWYPFFVLKGVQIGMRFTKETCAYIISNFCSPLKFYYFWQQGP